MSNKDKVYQAIDAMIKRQEGMLEQQEQAEQVLFNDLKAEVVENLSYILGIKIEDIPQDWIVIENRIEIIDWSIPSKDPQVKPYIRYPSDYNRRCLGVLNIPECETIYFYIYFRVFMSTISAFDSLSSLDMEKILLTGWHINCGAWHNPGLYFDTFAEALYKAKKLYNPNIDGKGDLDND